MKAKPEYRKTLDSVLGILNKAAEKELAGDKPKSSAPGAKKSRRRAPNNKPAPDSR